jgi:hypothetical protein
MKTDPRLFRMRPLRYSINVILDGGCDHSTPTRHPAPLLTGIEITSTLTGPYETKGRHPANTFFEAPGSIRWDRQQIAEFLCTIAAFCFCLWCVQDRF